MILMSDIRDSSMVEKGPKNSDTPPTPPYSGNARKKTFFLPLTPSLISRIELLVFFERQHQQQEQQVTAHQTAKHGVIGETLEGGGRQVRPL